MAEWFQSNISPPSKLDIKTNASQGWKLQKQMWNNYIIVTKLRKQNKEYQTALFLHTIGPDALIVYNGFQFTSMENRWLGHGNSQVWSTFYKTDQWDVWTACLQQKRSGTKWEHWFISNHASQPSKVLQFLWVFTWFFATWPHSVGCKRQPDMLKNTVQTASGTYWWNRCHLCKFSEPTEHARNGKPPPPTTDILSLSYDMAKTQLTLRNMILALWYTPFLLNPLSHSLSSDTQ